MHAGKVNSNIYRYDKTVFCLSVYLSYVCIIVTSLQTGPMGVDYIPTEEERRVFRECNEESFWYRSLPISVISMGLTQFLISRGALTASGRFGSLPKVAFAGFCGYIGGKISYLKTCKEKFKSLENSPLGEALKRREQRRPPMLTHEHTELNDADKTGFRPTSQLDDQRTQSFSYARDFKYDDPMTSASQSDTSIQNKPVLYEDLRSKDKENYDITVTQKSDIQLNHTPDVTSAKKGKKNIYGDTWEE
ncbi:OCIA domain-containing protein 1 isoform X1 [Paramisgurnus dabryanus]|uniref:OCIA domain-containing protein 1 isoform X1 n=2 Tax=Paramisgurnus dabryanus TaxID=90735 RepID=UPI0031F41D7F